MQRWSCHPMDPSDARVRLPYTHLPGRWNMSPEPTDSRCLWATGILCPGCAPVLISRSQGERRPSWEGDW